MISKPGQIFLIHVPLLLHGWWISRNCRSSLSLIR